ncbi:MAG: hypothetical protein OXC72_15725 [Roseovarius sp.]|nr:hypothetical protein [Roseovarius sp.]MCY4293188.1 hypothetical protein [Roseovarius sp.]
MDNDVLCHAENRFKFSSGSKTDNHDGFCALVFWLETCGNLAKSRTFCYGGILNAGIKVQGRRDI